MREGIIVEYHQSNQHSFYPYFMIDAASMETLVNWLGQRYVINIYTAKKYNQRASMDRDSVVLQGHYLVLKNTIIAQKLQDGMNYVLAKNNATISILSSVFQEAYQIQDEISNFINYPEIVQIPENQAIQQNENWFYNGLNPSQSQAINKAIKNRITFVKGPPGCGKTKYIARLCTIFSFYNYKLLIGAVSNIANQSIIHSILKQSQQMNYLPNIILYINKQMSWDNVLHPPEIRMLTFRQKVINNCLLVNQKRDLGVEELEDLLDGLWSGKIINKTFLSIYYQAAAKTFAEASVVVSTTVSANKMDAKLSIQQKFYPQIGILDEASQATWADTYCFLCKGIQKIVLVGDDKQLTPTIISQNEILKQTMFASLLHKNPNYYSLLNTQYRMHPSISQFPNLIFYNSQLINGITAEQRVSKQYKYFKDYPLSFLNHNTQQCQIIDVNSGKKNYYNKKQIEILHTIMLMFYNEKMKDRYQKYTQNQNTDYMNDHLADEDIFANIGIISPYQLQIRKIQEMLNKLLNCGKDQIIGNAKSGKRDNLKGLTVKTCDGYQGGEKDYIIFLCVRSNDAGKIGFCGEQNRVNVSLTRARKGLIVIGNAQTLKSQQQPQNTLPNQQQPQITNIWKQYLSYIQKNKLIFNSDIFSEYQLSEQKQQFFFKEEQSQQDMKEHPSISSYYL